MTTQTYETAIGLMSGAPSAMDFIGSRPSQLVEMAERRLGLIFPATYRRFLLEYGAGSFAGEEIYGVVDDDFQGSSAPNAVWSTLLLRREVSLPHNYIHIYSVGDGEIYCLSVNSFDCAIAPVVAFEPGLEIEFQSQEAIWADFSDFFLDCVQEGLTFSRNVNPTL